MNDVELFGCRVRALRLERGLTQERLAGRAELTTGFVNHIERGRKVPSLTTIIKLARALDVHPSELLSDVAVAVVRSPYS